MTFFWGAVIGVLLTLVVEVAAMFYFVSESERPLDDDEWRWDK